MSDLQCPVRLLLWPTPGPSVQALRGERLSAVVCAVIDAVPDLAVPVRADDGLRDPAPGESPTGVADRATQALAEVADLFRGETVVVVADPAVLTAAATRLAGRASWREHPGWPVELRGDADGWVVEPASLAAPG